MSGTMSATPRPGVVTFIGIVLYIQAAIAAIVGIALLFDREREALQELTGRDSDFIVSTAIVEIVIAILLFLVASAIMSGAKWARILVAVVVGIRLVVVGYWLVTHLGGALNWNAVIYAGFGIFVLWALYGNDKSDAYFEGAA
ncbi:MAG: DUF7144 family membrane protein [Acidimicrobiia bacterium]